MVVYAPDGGYDIGKGKDDQRQQEDAEHAEDDFFERCRGYLRPLLFIVVERHILVADDGALLLLFRFGEPPFEFIEHAVTCVTREALCVGFFPR